MRLAGLRRKEAYLFGVAVLFVVGLVLLATAVTLGMSSIPKPSTDPALASAMRFGMALPEAPTDQERGSAGSAAASAVPSRGSESPGSGATRPPTEMALATGAEDRSDKAVLEQPPSRVAEPQALEPPERILPGPVLAEWPLAYGKIGRLRWNQRRYPLTAVAYYYRSNIYERPARKPRLLGYARRGMRLPASSRRAGKGCRGGRWYRTQHGGYVCSRKGFRVGGEVAQPQWHYVLPDVTRPLPYQYAEVINKKAARLRRLPTEEELEQIALAERGEGDWPEVVERQMDGVFFLAIHEPVEHLGETYLRTVFGRYVRERSVRWYQESEMHGERLRGRTQLPLAFVYGSDRPLLRRRGRKLVEVGIAQKHARFVVKRSFARGGQNYVSDRFGNVVSRDAVRIARRLRRPKKVGRRERWIHVDLSEQTLVAYRGNRPVFATIISSGKTGYEPPLGSYRIVQKHVTTTMNGPDPIDGWYEVEEVPWTMYYYEGYALHGAYWHDGFGQPRSHGCTNLAPADARWLFSWASPQLPKRWHGINKEGTWVEFTG
jgi:hypothetical protein